MHPRIGLLNHPQIGHKSQKLVNRRTFRTRAEARLAIRHWIESWYNRRRLHSKLGYQSPIEWEDHYRHTTNTMAA